MTRRIGRLAPLALIAATATGAAFAQPVGFDVWDKSADGLITAEEFRAGPGGLRTVAAVPPETAPAAAGAEMAAGAFDLDRDGALNAAEFERAAAELGLGDAFPDWDRNGDGLIDGGEYAAGYAISGPAPAALGVDQEKRSAEARYDLPNWDMNGDGRLDAREFERVRTEFTLLESFSTFDLDGDGALSEAEYARVPRRTGFEGGAVPGDRPYYAFEDWDADASGALDRTEYAAFEQARLDAASGGLMGAVDADGDGAVTPAEFEAFAAGLRRAPSQAPAPRFAAFDTNRDGVIDRGEMVGLRNALPQF